jgi:hypothetical protein
MLPFVVTVDTTLGLTVEVRDAEVVTEALAEDEAEEL